MSQDQVIEYLRDRPEGCTAREIYKALDLRYSTVYRELRALRKYKIVVVDQRFIEGTQRVIMIHKLK